MVLQKNQDSLVRSSIVSSTTGVVKASGEYKGVETPVVEVHISNVYQREPFRHESYIAPNAKGIIAGFGLISYELALHSFLP